MIVGACSADGARDQHGNTSAADLPAVVIIGAGVGEAFMEDAQ